MKYRRVFYSEKLNKVRSTQKLWTTDATMDLSATDYVEIFAYIERTSGGDRDIKSASKRTYFGAYKVGA